MPRGSRYEVVRFNEALPPKLLDEHPWEPRFMRAAKVPEPKTDDFGDWEMFELRRSRRLGRRNVPGGATILLCEGNPFGYAVWERDRV